MRVRVHQQVLVVFRQETLNQLVRSLVDALDNESSLLWLDIEATALGLRDTDRDVFKILKRESVLNKRFTNVLDASDHIENFGS
jgi:hypothetical protein